MNTQATIEPENGTDDLVLRFVGGNRNGESVSVNTDCCMLGVTRQTGDRGSVREQCAIYRGPAGVAVQSHGAEVLVNGEAKSVHWLHVGDQIRLSNSQAVEVVQLGSIETEFEVTNAGAPVPASLEVQPEAQVNQAATQSESVAEAEFGFVEPAEFSQPAEEVCTAVEQLSESVEVQGDRIDFVSDAAPLDADSSYQPIADGVSAEELSDDDAATELPSTIEQSFFVEDQSSEEVEAAESIAEENQMNEGVNQRFESLETSVNQLHDQAANVDRRFDRLENSLSALTEHLERLASNSLSVASVSSESETATAEPVDSPAVAPVSPQVDGLAERDEDSIASLFNDLAKEDQPVAGSEEIATASTASAFSEAFNGTDAYQTLDATDSTGIADAADTPMAGQPAPGFAEQLMDSMESESPTLSAEQLISEVGLGVSALDTTADLSGSDISGVDQAVDNDVAIVENTGTVQGSAGLAEQLMDSMDSDSPTLSAEDLINEIGLGVTKSDATEAPIDGDSDVAQGANAVGAAVAAVEDTDSDQAPDGFAGQLMESMEDGSKTLSAEELINEVGLGLTEQPEPQPSPVRQEVRTESVAEIFARLQSGSSASEDEVETAPETTPVRQPVQTTFEDIQASISATLQSDVSDQPVGSGLIEQPTIPEPRAPETVEPAASEAIADDVSSVMDRIRASVESEEETDQEAVVTEDVDGAGRAKEDSVDDYMSMLLSRMRNDSGEATPEATPVTEEAATTASFSEPKSSGIDSVLTEEEFKPSRKAVPIKSLDKMRELANSTSRSAVQRSVIAQQEKRKKSLILQSLALGSLALSGVMFVSKAYTFFAAFACIFALSFGYVMYEVLRPITGLDKIGSSSVKKKVQGSAEPVADTEAETESATEVE